MIGKLSGIIDSIDTDHVILDVNGVGYVVFASTRTLGRIGNKGEPASLLIDTHVREDHIHLYGFADRGEQAWFRLLTSVQGVGAKVGLAILAACPPDRLAISIAAQDKPAIQAADGVGPKLATRILTELKDKAANMDLAPVAQTSESSGISESSGVSRSSDPLTQSNKNDSAMIDQDAVSALVNLGYARTEAYTAVMRIKDQSNDNLQELIRLALKELGR